MGVYRYHIGNFTLREKVMSQYFMKIADFITEKSDALTYADSDTLFVNYQSDLTSILEMLKYYINLQYQL